MLIQFPQKRIYYVTTGTKIIVLETITKHSD